MKVKITSDGTLRGTKVFDAESGEEIPKVLKIGMYFDWQKEQMATNIELYGVQCESVTADGKMFTEIAGKKYEQVELRDLMFGVKPDGQQPTPGTPDTAAGPP